MFKSVLSCKELQRYEHRKYTVAIEYLGGIGYVEKPVETHTQACSFRSK